MLRPNGEACERVGRMRQGRSISRACCRVPAQASRSRRKHGTDCRRRPTPDARGRLRECRNPARSGSRGRHASGGARSPFYERTLSRGTQCPRMACRELATSLRLARAPCEDQSPRATRSAGRRGGCPTPVPCPTSNRGAPPPAESWIAMISGKKSRGCGVEPCEWHNPALLPEPAHETPHPRTIRRRRRHRASALYR